MKILKEIEMILIKCGLGTGCSVRIAGVNIPRLLVRCTIFSFPMLCSALEVLLCVKFIKHSFVSCLWPFSIVLTFFSLALIYASLVAKTNEVNTLFHYFEKVIDQSKANWCIILVQFGQFLIIFGIQGGSFGSIEIYKKSNEKAVQMIQISFSVTNIAASIAHIIPALSPLLYIAIGYPSPDLWFTPFDIQKVSPFFERNPFGFLIAVATSEFITRMYIAGFKAFITTYVVTCVNIGSFADDISVNVDHLNENIARNVSIKKYLLQIVELHRHSYKVLEMLENIIRVPIFYQSAIYVLQLSIFLYVIEVNITTFSLNLITSTNGLMSVSSLNFVLCFFISASTLNTMSIGDRIYKLNWYHLTQNEQFIVYMMIQRSKRPFEIKALGVFICSLETFLKMIRGAVSYYMIFRKL